MLLAGLHSISRSGWAGFDWSPLTISLRVSLTATLVSIVDRHSHRVSPSAAGAAGRTALAEGIVTLPLVMPPTVLGYFLLVLFSRQHALGKLYEHLFKQSLVFTWQGAALAAAVASMPLLIIQSQVAFESIGQELEESARVSGATEAQVFFHIILPLARRGVVAGIALAFARALGDFGATLMVAGSTPGVTRTMPLAIYDALQSSDDKTMLTFVVITSLITITFTLLSRRYAYASTASVHAANKNCPRRASVRRQEGKMAQPCLERVADFLPFQGRWPRGRIVSATPIPKP